MSARWSPEFVLAMEDASADSSGGIGRTLACRGSGVRRAHVLTGLHLGEPACGALEFLTVHTRDVEGLGWRGRREEELHAMIVQDVHEPGEAPGGVGPRGRELRD